MTGQRYEGAILFKILVVIEPDGPGFHAYCPALKGLHVNGDSMQETIEFAEEAIISYLESLFKHGDPIPIGPGLQMEEHFPPLAPNAVTELLTIQWPIPSTSGISSRT